MPPSPRARTALGLGTLAIAALVAGSFRDLPPALAWAMPPYLVLVAWFAFGIRPRPRPELPPPVSEPEPEAVERDPLEVETSKEPLPATEPEPVADPTPTPGPSPRPVRTRRRKVSPALDRPSLASWVQVGPGRYIRGAPLEPDPAPLDEAVAETAVLASTELAGEMHALEPAPREGDAGAEVDEADVEDQAASKAEASPRTTRSSTM